MQGLMSEFICRQDDISLEADPPCPVPRLSDKFDFDEIDFYL